jgi:hypothetical protein
MTIRQILLASAAAGTLLAGCAHNRGDFGSSGDIAVDSLSASRTAILRIKNDYPSEVRVSTVIGGQKNYVAKAMGGQLRAFVLDPNLFPNEAISFETRPADGIAPRVLGPYKVNKGETIDLVVPPAFAEIHASVHPSM